MNKTKVAFWLSRSSKDQRCRIDQSKSAGFHFSGTNLFLSVCVIQFFVNRTDHVSHFLGVTEVNLL